MTPTEILLVGLAKQSYEKNVRRVFRATTKEQEKKAWKKASSDASLIGNYNPHKYKGRLER